MSVYTFIANCKVVKQKTNCSIHIVSTLKKGKSDSGIESQNKGISRLQQKNSFHKIL